MLKLKTLKPRGEENNVRAKNPDHFRTEAYAKPREYIHSRGKTGWKKKKIRHCKGAFVEAIWRALLQPREVQKAEETLVRGCAKLKMKNFLCLKNDLLERKKREQDMAGLGNYSKSTRI